MKLCEVIVMRVMDREVVVGAPVEGGPRAGVDELVKCIVPDETEDPGVRAVTEVSLDDDAPWPVVEELVKCIVTDEPGG